MRSGARPSARVDTFTRRHPAGWSQPWPKAAQAERNDTIVSLSKRRGFVYPSSEIYGGTRSAWDYGPLGVELKENVRRQWWKAMVQTRDDVVGLDSAVILAREVWVASGHVDTFSDPLSECQSCHKRFRADHLEEAYEAKQGSPPANGLADVNCPNCGTKGAFTEPRQFSGLLKTYLGPVESEEGLHYLRPETAQGIFVNFLNVMTSARKKPPFGIAQTGKSFRNEITPGNFIFRTREFEQMEMEFFVEPGTDEEWHDYWLQERWNWYIGLGLREDNLRFYEHPKEKLSPLLQAHGRHRVPLQLRRQGVRRARGHRQPHRLRPDGAHQALRRRPELLRPGEGRALDAVRRRAGAGLTRATLAFLLDAYTEDEAPNAKGAMEKRTVMRFDPRLAPVKAAVLPLSRNADLTPKARDLATQLRQSWNVEFDDAGAIGRRYRRQDEIGTPFCITVDFDTLDDQAVTIRERDTMQQERVGLDAVHGWLAQRLLGC